jgi:hypothetical protein
MSYTQDKLMLLSDGAAAYTGNGIGQVASANAILDLGGKPTRTDLGVIGGYARFNIGILIDVSAMVIGTNDDVYHIDVMGSNVAAGTNPVNLGGMTLGYGTLVPNGAHSTGGAPAGTGSDSYPGRYELMVATEQNGINYEYMYLYVTVAGTGKSITFTSEAVLLPLE